MKRIVVFGCCLVIGSCTPDQSSEVVHEICANDEDDDGDGLADCADPRCWTTAGCILQARCGNDVREVNELCDGEDLGGQSCETQGYLVGGLICAADCSAFDTDACIRADHCGDGAVQPPESCDGSDLAGETCRTRGYEAGTITCNSTCQLDETGCTGVSSCGDNAIDPQEDCDGSNLAGLECRDVGEFVGGALGCTGSCELDTSGCVPSSCGNGVVDLTHEACDGLAIPEDQSCSSLGFLRGTLNCDPMCALDTSQCTNCGNGVKDAGELCDGNDVGTATCEGVGLLPGILGCSEDCESHVTTDCAGCGDGQLTADEACDPTVATELDCRDHGYAEGTARCSDDCRIEFGECVGFIQCGNGVIDGQELCDLTAGNWFKNPYDGQVLPLNCAISGVPQAIACTDDCTLDIGGCGWGSGDFCLLAGWYNDGFCDPCDHISGTIDPDCLTDPDPNTCGDHVADGAIIGDYPGSPWEWCDGDSLRGGTCDFFGFVGGELGCRSDCNFDFSSCDPSVCGDGLINGYEICEPTTTCEDLGFSAGTLVCNDCIRVNDSGCVP